MDGREDLAFLARQCVVWEGERDALGPEHAGINGLAQFPPQIEVGCGDDVAYGGDRPLQPALGLLELLADIQVILPQTGVPRPPGSESAGKRLGDPVAETHLDLGQNDGQRGPDLLVPDIEGKGSVEIAP